MVDLPPEMQLPSCMIEAAQTYHIPLRGFLAIWLTEGGRLGMQNKNKNGTIDYGPFQINTVWAKRLHADFGVTPEMLTHDFCAAALASAYIIKYNIILENGDFWQGIGRYHSNTPELKQAYIGRVYKNSLRF
ncbi:lytic transglycosylase domain-containing protein [Serratia quinivorans]|jgi:hypothetical protein|uniref:lytic transglycosylase domain-containing protein n=1 Tax=Serratia quinivorans TaxID=137545 RepID=UPI0034C5D8D6